MGSTYPAVGNIAQLAVAFTDINGNPADPTTVTLTYRAPNTADTTITPTRTGTGTYIYNLLLNAPGTWYYRFTGTGAVTAQTGDQTFYVQPSEF